MATQLDLASAAVSVRSSLLPSDEELARTLFLTTKATRPPSSAANEPEEAREAGLTQPKTRRSAAQGPAVSTQREALCRTDDQWEPETTPTASLDDSQLALLIDFFTTLDRWDREAHGQPTM